MGTTHSVTSESLRYLDDFQVGQRFHSGTHTITADEIKVFAYEFDPQPFHMNEAAARSSIFGGLAASGWHTAALTMRLLATGTLPIAGGIIGRGGEIRWPRPTRPGDVLRVEAEVAAITPSRSKPDRGTVRFRVRTLNQKNEAVQETTMDLVAPRRPGVVTRPATFGLESFAATLLLLIGMLAGCAVGPDYQKPAVALGAFHNSSPMAARTAPAAPPLDRWWTGFDDPTLSSIVDRALAQNLDLAAALARVEQARAEARRAGAELLPTADATGSVAKARQSLESRSARSADISPDSSATSRHMTSASVLAGRSISSAASGVERKRPATKQRRQRRHGWERP